MGSLKKEKRFNPTEKREFKNLSEINLHILTETYGREEAERLMEQMKTFRQINCPSINKYPI